MKRLRDLLARRNRRPASLRPELTERLIRKAHIFQAPPLTKDLAETIHRISPQMRLSLDEASRRYWEAEQNGCCWGEFEALAPLLESLPPPATALELGPGLGRSVVFFTKKLGWHDTVFHLYEGTGNRTHYALMGPRTNDSFCGDIEMLTQVLHYNQMTHFQVYDARTVAFDLRQLPGPYDFIYSFYAIGFHWSLADYLDDLLTLMHDTSLACFTVPNTFAPFDALKQVSYRILPYPTVYPAGKTSQLLVLSKTPLP